MVLLQRRRPKSKPKPQHSERDNPKSEDWPPDTAFYDAQEEDLSQYSDAYENYGDWIDYARLFDMMTSFHSTPSYQSEHLTLRNTLGIEPEVAWDLLQKEIHPLDWFRHKQNLSHPATCFGALTSEIERGKTSFIAASEIHKEIMMKYLNGSFSHVLYLSQQQSQSHEIPIVFDTGASLSLTPFANDFVEPI